MAEPKTEPFSEKTPQTETAPPAYDDDSSIKKGDLLNLESIDPVLNEKMHMVNSAIDEIGFTPYHAKLFVLTGFGWV